jgi:hypothetical protein
VKRVHAWAASAGILARNVSINVGRWGLHAASIITVPVISSPGSGLVAVNSGRGAGSAAVSTVMALQHVSHVQIDDRAYTP